MSSMIPANAVGRTFTGVPQQFGLQQQIPFNQQMLGLTQPPRLGGGMFDSLLGVPQGGSLLGHGFGALFGNEDGVVDFGGGNFFQSGQGFFNSARPDADFIGPTVGGTGKGINFGSLFGLGG